jgi:hypothetical protein
MSDRPRACTLSVNTYGAGRCQVALVSMGDESGTGRDLGRAALESYAEQKTVWIKIRQLAARAGQGACVPTCTTTAGPSRAKVPSLATASYLRTPLFFAAQVAR